MTHVPLCQHRYTRPARLKGSARLTRCVDCGAEFALVEHEGALLSSMPPLGPTRRAFRYPRHVGVGKIKYGEG